MLRLYNTLTRKKEAFRPLNPEEVTMYACGPTVYDYPHIGNFRSFLLSDVIYRYLLYGGRKVRFVMNITDIDDKTIKRSGEEGLTLKEFTAKYEKNHGKNMAMIEIPYSADGYSVTYVDSKGLDVDLKKMKIHRNYVRWILNLIKAISIKYTRL